MSQQPPEAQREQWGECHPVVTSACDTNDGRESDTAGGTGNEGSKSSPAGTRPMSKREQFLSETAPCKFRVGDRVRYASLHSQFDGTVAWINKQRVPFLYSPDGEHCHVGTVGVGRIAHRWDSRVRARMGRAIDA